MGLIGLSDIWKPNMISVLFGECADVVSKLQCSRHVERNTFFQVIYNYFMCINVLPEPHACNAHGQQKRALDSLKLDFLTAMWMLGTKPGSPERTTSTLNH